MILNQILRFFGGMNKDSSIPDIKPGDTLEVLNARTISAEGNTTGSIETIKGNEYSFDVGTVIQQNKQYAIYYSISTSTIYDFTLLDQNNNPLTSTTINNAAYVGTGNIGGFLSFAISSIQAVLGTQTAAMASFVTVTGLDGYITFELTTVIGRNYFITDSNAVALQEAIDLSLTGKKEIIGSYDLLGDLFILSTPVTKASKTLTITGLTNTSWIKITTSIAHELTTGDNVSIKNVLGATSANGDWIVQVINSTQFYLIGSSIPGAWTGSGNVITTPNGYGEIGVAQKNIGTGTWTYTTLGNSINLPFRTIYQAEVKAEIDGLRKSIYWTDNNDSYRVAYYYGPYILNGLFSAYNTQGIYTYATIGDETRLFLGTPSPTINVTQTNGGRLKCGNWRYAVRFVIEGNIATEWSFLTNPINVFPRGVSGDLDTQFLTGGDSDIVSVKANIISISNIPTGVYNYVELAAIQYAGTVPIGSIAIRQQITQSDTSTTITHLGSSLNEIELDLTTLNQVFAKIDKGQNLTILNNRLIPNNFSVQTDYDLTTWASQIQYTVKRRTDYAIGYASTNQLGLYENFLPENTENYTGYMMNETYRFGVQVKWRNGGWSSPYFIDDIIFDTSSAGGQRLGGLTDYSLTNSGSTAIYIPYVEFTNLDLNFILSDGTKLSDKLDNDGTPNIRFVRADCIKEVQCTGVLIMGDATPPTEPNFEAITLGVFAGSTTYGYFYSPDVYFTSSFPGTATLKFLDNPVPAATYTEALVVIPSRLVEYDGDFTGSSFADVAITSISNVTIPVILTELERTDLILIQTSGALTPPLAGGRTDYGFYYVQLFNSIANKYGSIDATQYITTGNAFSSVGVTTSTTFDVFGGDAFTQKSFKIMTQFYEAVGPTLEGRGYGFGYYSQNRVNSQMQLKSDETDNKNYTLPGTNGASTAGLLKWLKRNEVVPGTAAQLEANYNLNINEYNNGYTIRNSIQQFVAFTSLPQQTYFPSRISWSEQKTINGISDAYRIILPLNFRDLDPSKGPITHSDTYNGQFVTWQTRAFSYQYFNSVGQLSSPDNSQILIGDGSVMSRIGDDLTKYGTSHKWSVVKGLSPGGKDTLYWINAENKKLIRFGFDGTVVLSDIKQMQSFFANNLQYVLDYTTPTYKYGICGIYNNRFSEAIFTIRAINPSIALCVIGQTIVVGDLRYSIILTFDGVPIVYKAKSSFVVNAANMPNGTNSSTYWDIVSHKESSAYNLYTIVVNEYINKVTAFFTPKPKIYLQYRDGYLSPHPTVPNRIYEHDRGEYSEWYSSSFMGTGSIIYSMLDNQVSGIGTNFLTEFPIIEGVVYYLNIGTEEYEVLSVESATSLTLSENSVISGSAPLSYNKVNSEDAYVEVAVNDNYDVVKGFNAIRVNSDSVPDETIFKTETQESFLLDTEYEEYEGYFESAIKNDSTITAENPTGSTEEDTSRLWGKYMKTKILFKKRKYNKMFDFIVKFVPKSRIFNK